VPARVVLGVGAGISAYKACELLRLLTESGHQVRVVPTPEALRFVGEATWAGLSGEPVATEVWDDIALAPHVKLGQAAELVLVAPATADLLARAATGRADDLLTATLLTATCPVVFAPAMHTEMWQHPATQANVRLLRDRGAVVIEPATGRLAGPDTGQGRLPDPAEIFTVAMHALSGKGTDLAGRRVLVSAGGTREEIDPVRFIGNWSSGTQGYALARTAAARGAEVTVIAANVALADPAGAKVIRVVSARDMDEAVRQAAPTADAVVMAAAVADYRPERRHDAKIKKDGSTPEPLTLTENPDILAGLGHARDGLGHGRDGRAQVLVGFAAETDISATQARAKLARKGCDLLVVNPVGGGLGFGTADNEAVIYAADGSATEVPRGPKDALADVVWDLVATRLSSQPLTRINSAKLWPVSSREY
jgi:phosphopantothenoylcysteine decarboxylase / phosphopantothenate---cysteine ligase